MTPDQLSVIVRALALVALFQAAGIAFFLALFGKPLTRSQADIRRVGRIAAAAGVVLVLAHLSLDATRMAGDFTGLSNPDLQRLAWESTSGIAQIAQVVGLLVIFIALQSAAVRTAANTGSVGAVIVIGAFLLTGHTSTHPLRWVLAPLLAVHLLIVAFWYGALIPLMLVSRDETPSAVASIVRRFSAIAGALVPLIALAGIAMAALLAGNLSVLRKPYGQLLLVKLGGFLLLLMLASYNRWRLTPALSGSADSAGGGPGAALAARTLRRSMATEYALLVAVLSVTAVLTAFFSPD